MAASHLLASHLLAATLSVTSYTPSPAPTGCSSIDITLAGGFHYSEITSIAGASQSDKTLIALHAAAGHLLSPATTDVAFIYTTETGLPVRLRDVVTSRLRAEGMAKGKGWKERGFVYTKEEGGEEDVVARTTELLGRVKLMRAFDFVGVIESVGEIGDEWGILEREKAAKVAEPRRRSWRRNEIPSSQDEEHEELDASTDDEMQAETQVQDLKHRGVGMIIIDNIANVLTVELTKDQSQGQALLVSFYRSLYHLTTNFRICTILINAVVGLSSSYQNQQRRPEDNVSLFPSVPGRPGLGQTYAHLIDLSIFVSSIPKTREDAETAYASNPRFGSRWQPAGIIEVIKDRKGCRQGQWGSFETPGNVGLTPYE